MTYMQLTLRRPTVLVTELELALREAGQDLKGLLRLLVIAALVLWARLQHRGLRWDSASRRHRATHREINDRAPLLLIVLGLVAVVWGVWSFGYMVVIFT